MAKKYQHAKSKGLLSRFNFHSKRRLLIVVLLVLALGGTVVALRARSDNPEVMQTNPDDNAQTTSDAETAQSDFTGGSERTIPEKNDNEGLVTDDDGNLDGVSTANPITSSTGEISLYAPQPNTLLQSGGKIAGSTDLLSVSFRLIDDVSGIIAQGQLEVSKGKFSGTFSFNTTATEGRLDVYGTRSNGVEFSNIEVPIRFR